MKKYFLFALIGLFLFSCSNSPKEKNEFYILQDGVRYNTDNVDVVELRNRVFSLASTKKDFSFLLSKEPIKLLANHKDIVKLTGTMAAWYPKKALLYNDRDSDLLSDEDSCMIYYGHLGEGCDEYISKKKTFGFEKHYAYTFAEYFIEGTQMNIESIQDVSIEKLKGKTYYLYFFRHLKALGEVGYWSHLKRTRISFN